MLHSLVIPNALIDALGWALLHFVWQGALIGTLAAGLLIGLRRRSANTRYLVATSALGLMALSPLATVGWILCAPPELVASSIHSSPSPARQPAVVPNDVPATQPQAAPDRVSEAPRVDAVADEPADRSEPTVETATAPIKPPTRIESIGHFCESQLDVIVNGWLAGVLLLSLRLCVGWCRVQRLGRRAQQPASAALQAVLARLIERLNISRAVRLVESALVEVPTVIGWLKPVILLPATALTGLSSEQLEALLAHELAHVRRNDYLINLLQTAIETLLFYHPAVWWLSRRMRIEREHCCDDLAVQVCGNGLSYARALVALEELRAPRLGLTISAAGGSLLGRIQRLVGRGVPEVNRSQWIVGLVAAVVAAALGIGVIASRTRAVAATEWQVTLPNGVTVALLGVSDEALHERSWWAPDGSRLRQPLPSGEPLTGKNRRGSTAQIGFHSQSRGLSGEQQVLWLFNGQRCNDSTVHDAESRSSRHWLSNRPWFSTTTIEARLTDSWWGPWMRITPDGVVHRDVEMPATLKPFYDSITVLEISKEGSQVQLAQPNDLDRLAQFEIRAADENGAGNHSSSAGGNGKGGMEYGFGLRGTPRHIEFRLRPYLHFVTFENVSLRQGRPTSVAIRQRSIPMLEQHEEFARSHGGLRQISVAELSEKIRESMAAFKDCQLEATVRRIKPLSTYGGPDVAGLGEFHATGKWQWSSLGDCWQAGVALTETNSGVAAMHFREDWVTGFDGSQHFSWDRKDKLLTRGLFDDTARKYGPQRLFWSPVREELQKYLGHGHHGCELKTTQVDGLPCYRFESFWAGTSHPMFSAVICPARSFQPLEVRAYTPVAPQGTALQYEAKFGGHTEVAPGVWAPRTIDVIERNPHAKSEADRMGDQHHIEITQFELADRAGLKPSDFVVQPPLGTGVEDLSRGETSVVDPWWPELANQLRERLEWPRQSLHGIQWLNPVQKTWPADRQFPDVVSSEANNFKQTSLQWLGPERFDWSEFDGKVAVFAFWTMRDPHHLSAMASLRRLHELHAKRGLRIVAIHEAYDAESVRQIVNELRLPFPVAIDAPAPASFGNSIKDWPGTAVLVNAERRVLQDKRHDGLLWKIEELLSEGHERPAKLPQGLHEMMPAEVLWPMLARWRELVTAAPQTSSITGRVMSVTGRPMANVSVEAKLTLKPHNAGVHSNRHDLECPNAVFQATSDAAGRFEFPKLTKGRYRLSATGEGLVVSPLIQFLVDGEVRDVVLGQGGASSLSGRVLNARGEPAAQAKVTLRDWYGWWTSPDHRLDPPGIRSVTAGLDGLFQFEGLDAGRYTLEVTSPELETVVVEKVPLGTADVEVRLKPLEPLKTPAR